MPVSTPHWITFVSACAHSGSFNLPSRTMGAPAVERAQMASWRGGCAHAVAATMHAVLHATASVVTRFMMRTSSDALRCRVGADELRAGADRASPTLAFREQHTVSRERRPTLGEVAARHRCK